MTTNNQQDDKMREQFSELVRNLMSVTYKLSLLPSGEERMVSGMQITKDYIKAFHRAALASREQQYPDDGCQSGYGTPCYLCGEIIEQYRSFGKGHCVGLFRDDSSGVIKWHHAGCIVDEIERLRRPDTSQIPKHVGRLF